MKKLIDVLIEDVQAVLSNFKERNSSTPDLKEYLIKSGDFYYRIEYFPSGETEEEKFRLCVSFYEHTGYVRVPWKYSCVLFDEFLYWHDPKNNDYAKLTNFLMNHIKLEVLR